MRKLRKTTIALSAVFGIFATVMTIMQLWFEILKFANGIVRHIGSAVQYGYIVLYI